MTDSPVNYNKKTITVGVFLILLLFFLISFALFHSSSTVDSDTMSYLIKYGRGDLDNGVKVLWNVHIIYGLYFKLFSYFSANFIAPVVFLTALSYVVILISGFIILKNHLSIRHSIYGLLLLFLVPGFHLLILRMEDNLPYLAGIGLMVACIDYMYTHRFSVLLSLLAGISFAGTILFHTLAVVFIFSPLLLLFSKADLKERLNHVLIIYAVISISLLIVLKFIPSGYEQFLSAFSGKYGIGETLRSLLQEPITTIEKMKSEFVNHSRVIITSPVSVGKMPSIYLKLAYILALSFTQINFYFLVIAALYLAMRYRKADIVLLSMVGIGILIPVLLVSFTVERLDILTFFIIIVLTIGIFKANIKNNYRVLFKYGIITLMVVFFFWDLTLYAQCTRWIYKPQKYQNIVNILRKNKIKNVQDSSFLFLEEESLYENNDYFILIRHYPRMKHLAIQADGKLFIIRNGWGTKRVYLTSDGIKKQFNSERTNYVSPAALKRFQQFYDMSYSNFKLLLN